MTRRQNPTDLGLSTPSVGSGAYQVRGRWGCGRRRPEERGPRWRWSRRRRRRAARPARAALRRARGPKIIPSAAAATPTAAAVPGCCGCAFFRVCVLQAFLAGDLQPGPLLDSDLRILVHPIERDSLLHGFLVPEVDEREPSALPRSPINHQAHPLHRAPVVVEIVSKLKLLHHAVRAVCDFNLR